MLSKALFITFKIPGICLSKALSILELHKGTFLTEGNRNAQHHEPMAREENVSRSKFSTCTSFKTRCYKCFFDDSNAIISIFSTFFSLWIVHNLLKLSVRFLQFIPSVDGCYHQVQLQSRTSKKD